MAFESIPDVRPLSTLEADLVAWLVLQAGNPADLVAQLPHLRVEQRCGCGCASVDFSVYGRVPTRGQGVRQVGPECYWGSPDKGVYAVFLFEVGGHLAGLDLYAIDSNEVPTIVPPVDGLRLDWSLKGTVSRSAAN